MRRRIAFAAAVSALAVAPASAGDGGFGGGTAFEVRRPSALAVGDFDNDGAPDLAAVSAGSKRVELFLPSPDGTVRSAPASSRARTPSREHQSASKSPSPAATS